MTQLEIAQQLRKQIANNWPFVKEILELNECNKNNQFDSIIKDRIERLLPREVFYKKAETIEYSQYFEYWVNSLIEFYLLKNPDMYVPDSAELNSMPIYQVLFATEEKPLGNYY